MPDAPPAPARFDWHAAGLRYASYSALLRHKFGGRVQKVSVDAHFTCPNVDGTVATGGCTFCDNRSFSPSRRLRMPAIRDQIDEGIRQLRRRYRGVERFIAYFQPATNTYAPVERLREVYEQALAHPAVVGLAIGTRPDCVGDEVLDLLSEIGARTYLSVEYGLQTIHDRTLDWMNRGHHYDAFVEAMARSRGRPLEICAHVILGLPGESHADMLATAREVAHHQLDGVKLHNLYAVKNTALADQVARGEVSLMDRDAYITTLVDFLELLPPTTLVERVSGDAPPDYFVGPAWCLDKAAVRLALAAELARRDTWQGKYFSPSPAAGNLTSPSPAAGNLTSPSPLVGEGRGNLTSPSPLVGEGRGNLTSPSPLVGEGRGEGEITGRRNFTLGGNKP